MKKLPIGIQTFEKIRSDDYIYIDKTKMALNLIKDGEYYFLSRPRRFGKSLFLDTLKNIFEAKKELFKDLYIYDKYDWSKKYPVIKISFGAGVIKSREELNRDILSIIKNNQRNLKIECIDISFIKECFSELIRLAYEKYNQKVVILVDEYDKPILDNITNIETAKEIREGLKNFYSVIKDSDEYVEFAFLTGVSKFSKVSIFSGLNNLEDITLDEQYGTICGYTQNDIETSFKELLNGVDLKELKKWYNGYNFLGENVYNPFDILLFISKNFMFRSYWFETGTPTFLIELIKKQNYFLPNLADIEVDESILDSFNIENINFETLLFQSGYLTIESVSKEMFGALVFKLKVPNFEVSHALNTSILQELTYDNTVKYQGKIYKSLYDVNLDNFKNIFETLFASIPYNNYTNNKIYEYEGFYASVIYSYLASIGLEIIAEDVTNRNRIDLTIKLNNKVFIIEFKVIDKLKEDNSKNSALEQIKESNYSQKYSSKETYLLGIEFCKDKKNICNFEWEKS